MKVSNLVLAALMSLSMIAMPGIAGEGKDKQQRQGSHTVIGKVTDTYDVELKGVAGNMHRLVKLENAKGDAMVVDLGIIGNLSELELSRGDHIIATGKSARINDRPVLFAKYVGKLHAAGRTGDMSAKKAARKMKK